MRSGDSLGELAEGLCDLFAGTDSIEAEASALVLGEAVIGWLAYLDAKAKAGKRG